MEEAGQKGLNEYYKDKYAELYVGKTLDAPYTINKSKMLAEVAKRFGTHSVLDLGSNVHGSIQKEGSLRVQMEKRGINYIGIASGFSYLAWLDEKFIPGKKDLSDAGTHSFDSTLHRNAKNTLAKYDELIDSEIHLGNLENSLIEALKQGDIEKIFKILNDIISVIVSDKIERETIQKFFSKINSMRYPPERLAAIQKIFINSKFPKLLLGNSALLVLRKGDKSQ